MADYSLMPVDHQPEFDHSLMPVDHDPFAGDRTADDMIAQARSVLASQNLSDPAAFYPRSNAPSDPAQQIASRLPGLERGVFDMARGMYGLPQCAIEAAQLSAAHTYGPGPSASSDSDPPWTDPLPAATTEAALTAMGGAPVAGVEAKAGEAVLRRMGAAPQLANADRFAATGSPLESRSSMMYNPPVKAPRSFEADYPGGGIADDRGKLRFDIDGRPLVGAHISGRRMVGGGDQAISPAEYDAISEGSIGTTPQAVSAASLPKGSVGAYRESLTGDGHERSIDFLRTLASSPAEKVVAHEMGHMLDELSGQIPKSGLNTELRQIYNTLNTGRERATNVMGPQHLGYSDEDVPREFVTEAIRAYMTNPNYIKAVAPKTAARIREYVNSNPRLNRTIQFNSGAGDARTGALIQGANVGINRDRSAPAATSLQFIPVDHDPFADD